MERIGIMMICDSNAEASAHFFASEVPALSIESYMIRR